MSLYESMPSTDASGRYQYLGVGDYVCKLLEIKNRASELKFVAEVEIVEARGDGAHRVGDNVSWLVNYGGDKVRMEMGRKDVRGFNDALIVSAGGDCSTWTSQQWVEFGHRCAVPANVAGVRLRAKVERYTKSDGTEGKIPRVTWIGLKGQPERDSLVSIYGASTTSNPPAAPKRPPLPPTPGGVAKHPQHATAVDAMRGYKEAGEEYGLGSDLHAWATGEGFSEAQYKAALAEAG